LEFRKVSNEKFKQTQFSRKCFVPVFRRNIELDLFICFAELLRKSAEHTLVDMVQVLFARIPEFKEDLESSSFSSMKKVQICLPIP